ncbi:MAG: hypothetical protein ACRD2X_15550, partial [Vicinamibacteraceae bacterium]
MDRCGGDPGILNTTLVLNGTPRTLVGIMPPRFRWYGVDVCFPATLARREARTRELWFLVLARNVDVGFNPDGRVAVEFDLRALGYSPERSEAFCRALLDRVRGLPAVRTASLAHVIPLGGRTTLGT